MLRVSHVEEEGEADSPLGMYRLGTVMHMGTRRGTLNVYSAYTQDTHVVLHMGEGAAVVYSVPELVGVSSQHTPPCLQARCPLKMMMTSPSTPCILWRMTRTLTLHGMVMLRLRTGTREVQVVRSRAHPTADLWLILDSSDPPLSLVT